MRGRYFDLLGIFYGYGVLHHPAVAQNSFGCDFASGYQVDIIRKLAMIIRYSCHSGKSGGLWMDMVLRKLDSVVGRWEWTGIELDGLRSC